MTSTRKTDAREADLEPGQKWTGWHRIEKDLWPQLAKNYTPLTPAERATYADDLMKNITTLDQRVQGLDYTVDQIANGSRGLLEEVAAGKVTGEEEYWSHTDLWDFQANVDGARVGFEGVKPIVEQTDPELAKTLTTRFADLQTLLDAQKTDTGFTFYDDLTPDEVKALANAVNALSEPLSQLTGGGAVLTGISRRGLVGGGVAAGLAAGAFAAGRATAADEGSTPDARDAYAFRGKHQAGITTPAQDRLHFAAFDVTTGSRAQLIALLKAWTEAADRMTRGLSAGEIGPTQGSVNLPPDDTGEAIGLSAERADDHLRLRPVALPRRRRQGPLRPRRPAAPGAAHAAALPRRRARPGEVVRRPLRPGVRRRPAGRRARDPQPGPDRLRHRRGPLVAARLRPYLDDLDVAVDAAQPLRLQGRHRQHQVRGDQGRRRSTSGSPPAPTPAPTGWPAAPTWSPAGST